MYMWALYREKLKRAWMENNDRSLGSTFAWLEFRVVGVYAHRVSVDSRDRLGNKRPNKTSQKFFFCFFYYKQVRKINRWSDIFLENQLAPSQKNIF